jgi:hypothetical protein
MIDKWGWAETTYLGGGIRNPYVLPKRPGFEQYLGITGPWQGGDNAHKHQQRSKPSVPRSTWNQSEACRPHH